MSIKSRTIKVNKDKSLSKIQYGKKDIWWFFQWLKLALDYDARVDYLESKEALIPDKIINSI